MAGIHRRLSFFGARKFALKAMYSSRRTVRARRSRLALQAGRLGWIYSGIGRAAQSHEPAAIFLQRRGPIAGRNWGRGPVDLGCLATSPSQLPAARALKRRRLYQKYAGIDAVAYVLRLTGALFRQTYPGLHAPNLGVGRKSYRR